MIRGNCLLYFYNTLISIGFLCNFFATILPFWFARYPNAQTRFLRLGLWEICLENFISPLDQQRIYDGCFFIFDGKIRPLWVVVLAGWFYVAQVLQILSMVFYTALVGSGFAMLLGLFDKLRPRTLLSSIFLLVIICWVLVTQLGVVGVNVDLEKKQTAIRGESSWVVENDQSGLSWSFGLAAFALLFVLIALNILVWCVYPRKERGGRLLEQAWTWPAYGDLPCCLAQAPPHGWETSQNIQKTRSLTTQQARGLTRQPSRQTADPSGETDLSYLGSASYDPRSAEQSERGRSRKISVSPAGPPPDTALLAEASATEAELEDFRIATQDHDPRTAVDVNFSRVSSLMSSVRSSIDRNSGRFERTRNRTYNIKRRQCAPEEDTIIPKPMIPGRTH